MCVLWCSLNTLLHSKISCRKQEKNTTTHRCRNETKRDKRISSSTFNNKNVVNGKHNVLSSSLKEKRKRNGTNNKFRAPSSTSTSSINAATLHGANPITMHQAINKSHATRKLLKGLNTSCQFYNKQLLRMWKTTATMMMKMHCHTTHNVWKNQANHSQIIKDTVHCNQTQYAKTLSITDFLSRISLRSQ